MNLRRKRNSCRPVLAVVIGVLALSGLAAPLGGQPAWRELRLKAPLSPALRAQLADVAQAAGGRVTADEGGQLTIRLDGTGLLPQSLLDWARRSRVPLPCPTSETTIGLAEAVFCAKDSPAGAAAMAAGPALTGRVAVAQCPAWRPFDHPREEPCLPSLVLAEHLAGRSPPGRLIG